MALASDRIRADCVEASEFPHLVNRYSVRAVPKVVIDGTSFEGARPEAAFVQAVLSAAGSSP